jgi:hypothetical protein
MKKIVYLAVLIFSMFGCITHMPIDLTPGGQGVSLISSELPLIIPNRPLDRCDVLSQITILTVDRRYVYWTTDMNNALRNKTADAHGNVAIKLFGNTTSVYGMALHCPDEVLKAAGFLNPSFFVIHKGSFYPTDEPTIRKRNLRQDDSQTGAFL